MISGNGIVSANEAAEQLVTVCLGDEIFGIPISYVESIVRWEPLTRLPRLPGFLVGIYNLRGQAVPVVDLRMRLEIPATPCGSQQRIVIVQKEGLLIGLIVDGVQEVIWAAPSQIETNVPLVSGDIESAYLRGVANLPQGFVILLDLENLLSTKEHTTLTKLQAKAQAA